MRKMLPDMIVSNFMQRVKEGNSENVLIVHNFFKI